MRRGGGGWGGTWGAWAVPRDLRGPRGLGAGARARAAQGVLRTVQSQGTQGAHKPLKGTSAEPEIEPGS